MNDYNFGNFVCQLREEKGLTQSDVAIALGVTPAAVSKWENGASKPRAEVLFELAKLLGVRPEELMAGHCIPDETLDPEAVKRINERYEYLQKIDAPATTSVKIRRILAWIVDWNIIGFSVILLTTLISMWILPHIALTETQEFVFILCMWLLYPIGFILRDILFGGRSPAKRMFGLVVLDKQSGEAAKPTARLIRNLFLFILQIDLVIMLIRGESIGDTVAHTVVISKKDRLAAPKEKSDVEKINSYTPPQTKNRKKIIITVSVLLAALVLFGLFIYGIVSVALNAQTKTDEYQMAYTYLVESEEFKALGISENDIKFNSYSKSISTNQYGETSNVLKFGFRIGFGHTMTVVCHKDGDAWYVCEDCTHF